MARLLSSREGEGIGTVYCYDHAALQTFRTAARLGRRRIYDLPIGYWREHDSVLREELARWPLWAALAPKIDFASDEFRRKDAELALAELIVVPSRFVARTLAAHGRATAPVAVVPFAAPPTTPLKDEELSRARGSPLRALFVGGLDLRKGVPDLFTSLRMVGPRVAATVVGRPRAQCSPLAEALREHRWLESLPRGEVLKLMRASEVFVFPTLFEGMALVVLEAMSQGCVVITTANSGAEDLIEHGVSGFIVPTRAPEAIAEIVDRLSRQPDELATLRIGAQRRASERGWSAYRAELCTAVAGG